MKPLHKGLLIALAHVAIVTSLGAKLLYDRSTRPRVWARAAPYDPDLPIRGRYVSLQLEVEAVGIDPPKERVGQERWQWQGRLVPVLLSNEDGRLVARRDTAAGEWDGYREDKPVIAFRPAGENRFLAVLTVPVLYFIPEHVEDPSRRQAGEELWVEVTLPRKGPPRPIRLGVKKGDGPIMPLDLD